MRNYFKSILLLIGLMSFAIITYSQDTLQFKIAEKAPVYYTYHSDSSKIMFYANANDKVKVFCRYGVYQVEFDNKAIGWVDKLSIQENRIMVVNNDLTVFKEPDFNKRSEIKFQTGDTIYYQKTDKKNIFAFVKNSKASGWIKIFDFKPVNETKIAKYEKNVSIISYENLLKKVKDLSYTELLSKFGVPVSVMLQNNLQKIYYSDITIVKEGAHFHGIFLFYNNSGFVKDSLIGKGENQWCENLPLAPVFRGISLGTTLNIGNWSVFKRLGEYGENNTLLKILFFILKIAFIISFFILPIFISKYFYNWIYKIKLLPNWSVIILNYVSFVGLYYLYFLLLIIQIFYVLPWFFTIGMIISLIYAYTKNRIFEFNSNLDRIRCPKCHSIHTMKVIKIETLNKKHTTKTYHWRDYLGTSTKTAYSGNVSVTVTTNYYQNHSKTYPITVYNLKDYIECSECKNLITKNRIETKSGHV